MSAERPYDVIVVGAGHAGCEAAAAAATMGGRVLLVTMNLGTIGQMSCNPAMGGVAKGQIVREIDALGGRSGIISDISTVQFRMLNRSKGPAMWSPRSQNDRDLFATTWRRTLEAIPNVHFLQDTVTRLHLVNAGPVSGRPSMKVAGVVTGSGRTIPGLTVVLTSGTFMNGVMHIGEKRFGGGRAGEKASHGLTEQLVEHDFSAGRMKTGTPPRVDGRSIDYSKLEEQPGDPEPGGFSYLPGYRPSRPSLSCWITQTDTRVHDALREGFDRSPMFNGRIQGLGPRYCPSIEDKIDRFANKDSHQIFVEPEGWDTIETYINGFSTSLPEEVQSRALRLLPGFENARIFRPGYAVEYDYFPPTQLDHSLETKLISNLFFAGQINGTTGYEEAAGQGLMAGINAYRKTREEAPFILGREEAYIGVLIDDLITKGTEEPYRMFTSRAEYRLLLRQDNADQRLTHKGEELGLATPERVQRAEVKAARTTSLFQLIQETSAAPEEANPVIVPRGTAPIKQKTKLHQLLLRPQLGMQEIEQASPPIASHAAGWGEMKHEVCEQVEIRAKYDGYINKERQTIERVARLEGTSLPTDIEYHRLSSLSTEARQKLQEIRPRTLGQATRISGVSPADISVLMVYLGR